MGVGEITGILDYSAVSVRMTGATQCHEGRVLRDRDLECIVFVMGWSWAKRVILPITQTKKNKLESRLKKDNVKNYKIKQNRKVLNHSTATKRVVSFSSLFSLVRISCLC